MQFSIRALFILIASVAVLVAVGNQLYGEPGAVLVLFVAVLIVASYIGTREFGRGIDDDPPNFS